MTDSSRTLTDHWDVSRETLKRLELYAELLARWSAKINLVSSSTLTDLWSRHFVDSAQVLHMAPSQARTWCDLGSGGGFPGLVVAVLAHESRPEMKVTLIEADTRKSMFLRTVIRETGVPVTVINDRIESVEPQDADIVSARALAPLNALLGYASMHMKPSGAGLFQKGARYAAEYREALAVWSFRCEKTPSLTDADAVILKVSELSRA